MNSKQDIIDNKQGNWLSRNKVPNYLFIGPAVYTLFALLWVLFNNDGDGFFRKATLLVCFYNMLVAGVLTFKYSFRSFEEIHLSQAKKRWLSKNSLLKLKMGSAFSCTGIVMLVSCFFIVSLSPALMSLAIFSLLIYSIMLSVYKEKMFHLLMYVDPILSTVIK